ncbi:unnamed protein product, partial [Oppiella nova]
IIETNGLLYMTLDSNPGGIRIAEKLGLHKHEELPRFFNKFVYSEALWSRLAYRMRDMTVDDIPRVLQIWAELELQEGSLSVKSFLSAKAGQYVVAVDNRTDQILGVCALTKVMENTYIIGLYGVDRRYQGLGIGSHIFSTIMTHIGPDDSAVLFSEHHLQDMYRERLGFSHDSGIQLIAYECRPVRTRNLQNLVDSIAGIRIKRIGDSLMDSVVEYDRKVHRQSRAQVLNRMFSDPECRALVAIDESGDQVAGYGVIHMCSDGNGRVGPLYADSESVAELLLRELIDNFPEMVVKGLIYEPLANNTGAMSIADKLGLKVEVKLPVLFTKQIDMDFQWDKVYCSHSPNFSII